MTRRTTTTLVRLAAMASMAMVATASTAHADQWCLNYDGYGAHSTVGLNYDSTKAWDAATRTSFSAIKVGEHKFNQYGGTITTYCVQLFEGLTAGSSVCFDVVGVADVPDAPPAPGPLGAIGATLMQDLYYRFYAFASDQGQDEATRNVRCAAFGLAVYEISHENLDADSAAEALGRLSLVLGAFQVDAADPHAGGSDAFALAASMLADLGEGGFYSLGDRLFGLTNETEQDQLVVVPLPAAAGLAALGLFGARTLRRRIQRTA